MKKIAIATPAVWAGPGMINNFIGHIAELINDINSISNKTNGNFIIEGALLEIQNTSQNYLINYSPTVIISELQNSADERIKKGMAHWWFSNVNNAFVSMKVDGVLYLPIDINWDDNSYNTVSNIFRLFGMIKLLISSDNNLVIGNYECSNIEKEFIENYIYNLFVNKYPNHNKEIKRVRSEFWAITADAYKNLMNNINFNCIADPTLLILTEIMRNNIKINIQPFDLGRYEVFDEYDDKKKQSQIERARKLI